MVLSWRAHDGPTLNAGSGCDFSGDPYQYCQETLIFCDFSRPPVPPLDHVADVNVSEKQV